MTIARAEHEQGLRTILTAGDRLDDITRARMWSRIEDELAAPIAPRAPATWKRPAALAVAALAAAAAIVIVLRASQTPVADGSGLVVAADATLHTRVGPHARAALVGPAQLELVGTAGDATRVRLGRGTLLADFTGGPGRSLRIETGDLVVEIVGTLFAIEITDRTTCVSVAHGTVRVTRGTSTALVTDRQQLCSGDAAPHPLPADVAEQLARHEQALQLAATPPSRPARTDNGARTAQQIDRDAVPAPSSTESRTSPTPAAPMPSTNIAAPTSLTSPPLVPAASPTPRVSTPSNEPGTSASSRTPTQPLPPPTGSPTAPAPAPSTEPRTITTSSSSTVATTSPSAASRERRTAASSPSSTTPAPPAARSSVTSSEPRTAASSPSSTTPASPAPRASLTSSQPRTTAPSSPTAPQPRPIASPTPPAASTEPRSATPSPSSTPLTPPSTRASITADEPRAATPSATVMEPIAAPKAPSAGELYRAAEISLAKGDRAGADRALAQLIALGGPLVDQALYERARIAYQGRAWSAARGHLAALAAIAGTALAEPGRYLDCRIAVESKAADAERCFTAYRAAYPRSPHDLDVLAVLAQLAHTRGGCAAVQALRDELIARYPRADHAAAWRSRCSEAP